MQTVLSLSVDHDDHSGETDALGVIADIYTDMDQLEVAKETEKQELKAEMDVQVANLKGGNTELENKFSEAIKLLKRDIVFAASLYL